MTARLSLAEQLKALQDDAPKSIGPEEAYADLDGHDREGREGGREHYVDVGPSRLRAAVDADAAQTLLSDKYGGKASSRMKIFDDEEEEEDVADGAFDEDEDEDEEGDEEEGDEDDEEEEDDEDEEDEEDEEEEEEEDDTANAPPSGRTLDPVGALRASRAKDIEKGRGIKRQRDLFDSLLTLRITFQKALGAAFKLPATLPSDAAGEVEDKRGETLRALAALSDNLFTLREGITLPGAEAPRKRRRVGSGSDAGSEAGSDSDADPTEEAYWTRAAADSFAITDAAHPALVPVLNKWSTKIHAASLSLAKPGAGGSSKFLASTRGAAAAVGVVDAIDAALAQRRDNPKPMLDVEESGYRALLREVIESRQGGVDVMHLRREKKKKREAERGGSKGRKLRYTVHDKAANFVVPVPLEGWHEEQIDELFSSLFGGVGAAGAVSAMPEARADEVADLGGLRVF